MSGVYIGLGSNLGDGSTLIRSALAQLGSYAGIRIVRVSSLYRSAPWGLRDQPDFTNAVAELSTELEPEQLLCALMECERRLGRVRSSERWGPRSIDIDLLIYADRQLHTSTLALPHPRMADRAFVLVPLLELAPCYVIPGIGPASACLERLADQKVERIG